MGAPRPAREQPAPLSSLISLPGRFGGPPSRTPPPRTPRWPDNSPARASERRPPRRRRTPRPRGGGPEGRPGRGEVEEKKKSERESIRRARSLSAPCLHPARRTPTSRTKPRAAWHTPCRPRSHLSCQRFQLVPRRQAPARHDPGPARGAPGGRGGRSRQGGRRGRCLLDGEAVQVGGGVGGGHFFLGACAGTREARERSARGGLPRDENEKTNAPPPCPRSASASSHLSIFFTRRVIYPRRTPRLTTMSTPGHAGALPLAKGGPRLPPRSARAARRAAQLAGATARPESEAGGVLRDPRRPPVGPAALAVRGRVHGRVNGGGGTGN